MYIGHFAAGLVLKARVREAPLGWLLFGSAFCDLLCGVLLLAGVEGASVRGSLVFGNLDARIGYSHSLTGSLACAVLVGLFAARRGGGKRIGLAVGLAVLSHYLLDALSHRPDMPLLGWGAEPDVRLGTGLAAHPAAFYFFELGFCLLAWALYDRRNRHLLATLLGLAALYTNAVFGFYPIEVTLSDRTFELVMGLVMVALFGGTALLLLWAAGKSERAPQPRTPQPAFDSTRREEPWR